MARSRTRAGRTSPFADAPVYLVAIVLTAIVLVPIVFVVLGGFRTTGQIAADPVLSGGHKLRTIQAGIRAARALGPRRGA